MGFAQELRIFIDAQDKSYPIKPTTLKGYFQILWIHVSGFRILVQIFINPTYLDWAFCQPKKTGGGAKCPLPSNLVSSSQMTIKLGKDILWVEIFTN